MTSFYWKFPNPNVNRPVFDVEWQKRNSQHCFTATNDQSKLLVHSTIAGYNVKGHIQKNNFDYVVTNGKFLKAVDFFTNKFQAWLNQYGLSIVANLEGFMSKGFVISNYAPYYNKNTGQKGILYLERIDVTLLPPKLTAIDWVLYDVIFRDGSVFKYIQSLFPAHNKAVYIDKKTNKVTVFPKVKFEKTPWHRKVIATNQQDRLITETKLFKPMYKTIYTRGHKRAKYHQFIGELETFKINNKEVPKEGITYIEDTGLDENYDTTFSNVPKTIHNVKKTLLGGYIKIIKYFIYDNEENLKN